MPTTPVWMLLLTVSLSAPEPPPSWPAPKAPLTVARVEFPKGFGKKRIYLDAGHGAPGNPGNTSVTCEPEESFTLRVAQDLAQRLEATGHFQVKLSRKPGQRPMYPARLEEAERWRANLIETHHALDLEEVARWREERTLEAFAAAVAWGLVDALAPPERHLSSRTTRPVPEVTLH
jgi:N-acetylmuramoyl-L-alanine amidase